MEDSIGYCIGSRMPRADTVLRVGEHFRSLWGCPVALLPDQPAARNGEPRMNTNEREWQS